VKKRVAIIGSGLGGLAAAAWLANKGVEVHVFEKNEVVGGRVNRIEFDGFIFDTGPVLLTLPSVVDELWQACGRNRQDYFQLLPLDPIFRYFLNDTIFETYSDIDALKFQISKLPEHNIRDFVDFIHYSKKLYNLFSPSLLYQPLTFQNPLKTELFFKFLFNFQKLGAFQSVHGKVHQFFQNSPLEYIFDRYSVAFGSDPYQAPAVLNMFPWIEYGFGSFYIPGGMFNLVIALEKLCRQVGAHIHTSASVERIDVQHNQAVALHVNGEPFAADAVISNADSFHTLHHLLGDTDAAEKIASQPTSPSGLMFLWGVRGETRQFDHLNVVIAKNPEHEYARLFNMKKMIDDPTIQVSISSKIDEQHAPQGYENWCVLLKMPFQEKQSWARVIEHMRAVIFSRLKSVNVDLHGRIEQA